MEVKSLLICRSPPLKKMCKKSKERRKSHYFEAAGAEGKDKPEALAGCGEKCRAL